MPLFSFQQIINDDRRMIAEGDFPDDEAARMHALDLAGKLLDESAAKDLKCRIVICDAQLRDLDFVISERF